MGKRLDLLTGQWKEDYKGKRKSPEASVGKAVDAYLKTLGSYTRVIKSDGSKMSNGRWRPSAQGSGISDRLCWLPNGICLAVELKAPGKKKTLSTDQYNFLLQLLKRGHRACVADCIEDVKKALTDTLPELLSELDKWKPKSLCHPEPLLDLEPLFP